MLDYIDSLPLWEMVAIAGFGLAVLATLARMDRANAREDRRLSEIDRNAAADLYRRAAVDRERAAEMYRLGHQELQQVVALYQSRESAQVTTWESLGIVARNVG